MYYQGQMMNPSGSSCGCNDSCPIAAPTATQCNQVLQTCNVQEVPHYTCYHTHVVNNCIKKHINIPVYSQSSENVLIDEYVQGQPIYQQPVMYNQNMMNQPMAYNQGQYQGNLQTEPLQNTNNYQNMANQMNPFQQMPNMMNPFNN